MHAHILGIVLTGTSVNPARSFGPALMMATQGETLAIAQVWVFILAPLVGAAAAAGLFAWFKPKKD
ncbi:MAG: aquaporin [Actinomycetaceae bacterium]|nr:aquaporin [Actinomycetaceae bacterium]